MDFEKIAREKIKQGCISVETLAEWLKEAYKNGYMMGRTTGFMKGATTKFIEKSV